MVLESMDCLFRKMPHLRVAYNTRFNDNSDSRRKFISGCHVLREPDLNTWILMVLSKKERHSDSLKRQINSLDNVPEAGLLERLIAGEPVFKKPSTEAATSSARRQEDPPLID